MDTFGARLRRLRNERGMTVVDLAERVNAAEGSIRQLENGAVKSPGFLLGIKLADALGVDPRALALGEATSTADQLADHDQRLRALEQRLAALESRRH